MTGTVSTAAMAAMAFNILFCFGVPIGLFIWLILKKKSTAQPVLVGGLVFFVFQMVLRIPLLQNVLAPQPWFQGMMENVWVYGIFLGGTAGLFEELGRFAGYRLLLKKESAWWDGFAFGVGHGGVEAILLTGITNVNNLLLAFLINSGKFDVLAKALPAETAQLLWEQMTQVGPVELLIGSLERLFAMTVQIAFSILVLYAIRVHRPLYVALAVVLHTLVDSPVVILQVGFGWNIYALEAVVGVTALAAGTFLWYSHKVFVRMDGKGSRDFSHYPMPRGSYESPTPYVPEEEDSSQDTDT